VNSKLFIGPMSKNTVDAVLEMEPAAKKQLAFIPSRRQVEHDGGYVNNWTTDSFANYVRGQVWTQRDHAGPGQGNTADDGLVSLAADAQSLDMIHVDPWKRYQDYQQGLSKTIECIKHVHALNSNVLFEVGTEESIRKFTVNDLRRLLEDLEKNLPSSVFSNIRFGVVQSGVGLDLLNRRNTGEFSLDRLTQMCQVTKEFGLLSKEHNGDYLTPEDIEIRFSNGLDAINIAPEFGQIETLSYVKQMSDEQLDFFYEMCLRSKRWEKWVSLDNIETKTQLIAVCGHYVFSHNDFSLIKPSSDSVVKLNIEKRINKILKAINKSE
tara:strand:- start:6618 stop:7586 length:969 start_codon:yes stop_codon:yes gene_type:complete